MKDYHINIFYSAEDGGYIADIPDLNICSAFGNTPEEALVEVTRAKALWIEVAQSTGKPIPPPRYRPEMLDYPLRHILIEESRRANVAKELRELIATRELELGDDNRMSRLFEKYVSEIPPAEQPENLPQKFKLYEQWEAGLKQELAEWRNDLETLGPQSSDPQAVLEQTREKIAAAARG